MGKSTISIFFCRFTRPGNIALKSKMLIFTFLDPFKKAMAMLHYDELLGSDMTKHDRKKWGLKWAKQHPKKPKNICLQSDSGVDHMITLEYIISYSRDLGLLHAASIDFFQAVSSLERV